MHSLLTRWIWLSAFALSLLGCGVDAPPPSYLDRLDALEPHFTYSGPSPQGYSDEEPPDGVQVIDYISGDMSLKAWLVIPERSSDKPIPGIVYIHGGFALGAGDLVDALPFRDAGFAVMTPMLRGENGNPGNFELLLGEVEDAAAAVRWLASQPYIDSKRLYAFGHSTGGAISALLALRTDAPVVHTGSSGGLYPSGTFDGWSDIVPFDLRRDDERSLRLLLGNQRWMQKPHIAFLGESDSLASSKKIAEKEAVASGSKLAVEIVPGDHFSNLPTAIEKYIISATTESP